MYRINKTLIYFLVLTIFASFFAVRIIVTAYDNAYASYLTE